MNPERRRRIDSLCARVLAKDPRDRGVFLDEACGADAALRREVESLLAGRSEVAGFLETPAWAGAGEPLTPGTRFGPYEIESFLGAGGMGEVYRARDTRLGRTVAIKVLPPVLAADPDRRRRFEHEARAASALNHPNICTVFDVGEGPSDSGPFIVMELMEGQPLGAMIGDGGVPIKRLLDVTIQIADALETAHRAGIIHRDIKPANVFVTDHGDAKLLDFGLAKLQQADLGGQTDGTRPALSSLTAPGAVVGTVTYMSPEQVLGQPLDPRTDLFSLGALLYEMTTGRQAFRGNTAVEVLDSVLHRAPAAPVRLNPLVPPDLEQIIAKALEKDREVRYQSAADMRADLERLRRHLSSAAMPPGSRAPTARRPRWSQFARRGAADRRVQLRWWMAGALAAVALFAAGYVFFERSRPVLTDQDVILISEWVNTTGDPVFDSTLKRALAMNLEQSPFLSLFPERSIGDTLRLMGRSPDDKVTGPIAREICQREALKAVLEGSIAALGNRYLIMVTAVDCQSGASLLGDREEAAGKEHVIRAMDTLASRLRRRLGESLASVQRTAGPLERATTTSLDALQAYDRGWKEQMVGRRAGSVAFFDRAIELDPNFAEAYVHLANVHSSLGNAAQAVDSARKAWALRGRVTESERYHVADAYYRLVPGDLLKRIENLESWQRAYPRNAIAAGNLGVAYADVGRYEDAAEECRRSIALDSGNVTPRINLAGYYMALGRLEEAKALLTEVARTIPDNTSWSYQESHANLYLIATLQGDTVSAQKQFDWEKGKPQEATFLWLQSRQVAQSGQFAASRRLFGQAMILAGSKPFDAAWYALGQAYVGNEQVARKEALGALGETRFGSQTVAALALALAGDSATAGRLAAEFESNAPADTRLNGQNVPWIRAAIAYRRHDSQKAIEHLEVCRRLERTEITSAYLRGLAHLQARAAAEAAADFQQIIDRPTIDQFSILHPLARLGKARAAAMAGDPPTSRKGYQDFLAWWKDADADIPLLRQAKGEYETLTKSGLPGRSSPSSSAALRR